ncbi:MAG: HAD family hydrolase, partial [Gammaproteobacteria bacterium]|nr:HAD family hydrolase [Gammaproteobacteria bacterium]
PGREQVLASQPRDYRQVVQQLQQLSPPGHSIVYQKQMTHHIAADMDLDWLGGMTHGFLLRQPRKMLASLLRVLPDAGVDDTGLPQQLRLYRSVCECSESAPPVVDSDELLRDPQTMLTRLCTALGVEFDQAMLHWPAGPRASDGVWAPYWYASVERSTGFAAPVDSNPEIPSDKHAVLDTCEKIYSELSEHRIRP